MYVHNFVPTFNHLVFAALHKHITETHTNNNQFHTEKYPQTIKLIL